MLRPLVTYLAAELGLEIGRTLFAGHRPAAASDACTTVLERVGTPVHPLQTVEHERRLQLLTRGTSYFTAEDEAWRVFGALVSRSTVGIDLPGWRIHGIVGTAPAYIGQDDRGRFEFSANVTVKARKQEV